MDREEIIRTAREAGVSIRAHYDETGSTPQELERFFNAAYAAGAAAEREVCAKVCDEQAGGRRALEHYAALTYSGAANDCAEAIRARGDKE